MTTATKEAGSTSIRPFTYHATDAELNDLRRRIKATRWPERETVADTSQGVPLTPLQDLARYWATDYDWRKCEAKLNALPQFITELDGLDIQAQVASDLELREPFAARFFGGLNATLRANEMVSVFVETSINFKYMGEGDEDFALEEPFRFMVATFGIKFRAAKGHDQADQDGRMDLGLAANIPYSYNYWGFYRGAVGITGDYYLGKDGMNW